MAVTYGTETDTYTDVKVYKRRATGMLKLDYVPLREEILSLTINGNPVTTEVPNSTAYNYKRVMMNKMPYISRKHLRFPRGFKLYGENTVEIQYKYNKKFT